MIYCQMENTLLCVLVVFFVDFSRVKIDLLEKEIDLVHFFFTFHVL